MLPATCRQHRGCWSVPEDGQNNCRKHVELTGIIKKPLLLHLVGCLYYLYQWRTVKPISYNEIYLLMKYFVYKKRSLESSETPVLYRGRRCLKVKWTCNFPHPVISSIWSSNNPFRTLFSYTSITFTSLKIKQV